MSGRLKAHRTFNADIEVYERLKQILVLMKRTISDEINELLKKRLAELEGQDFSPTETVDYERLKREHTRLYNESVKIKKALKRGKVFESLMELAGKVGLDFKTLGNLQALTPKLLSEWNGLPHYMHEFITMLETIREMKIVEQKLSEFRKTRPSKKINNPL